jgi:hypothetical protein
MQIAPTHYIKGARGDKKCVRWGRSMVACNVWRATCDVRRVTCDATGINGQHKKMIAMVNDVSVACDALGEREGQNY